MAKIKVLKKSLNCPVCSSDEWHVTRINFMGTICLKDKFIEQERKILECVKCGYGMWFGIVEDFEDGTKNLEIFSTEYDSKFNT